MYTCWVGDHAQIQDYNDGIQLKCTTNYDFINVSLVQNVALMRFFSSMVLGLVNIHIEKISTKAKTHDLENLYIGKITY